MQSTPRLIERLKNAADNSPSPLRRRMADMCLWWTANRPRIPPDNLRARMEFNELAMSTLLEIQAMLLERLDELEHGKGRSEHLYLPRSITLHDPIRANGG